jgi:CheY-like chemotaxis protein
VPGSQSAQCSVLIVDDDENDFLLVKRVFEKALPDWRVFHAPGGVEAIAYLGGDPPYFDRSRYPLPTIVLLDIKMPLVDGYEVLRWIRAHPELSALVTVMLTSSDAIPDAERAYRLGATSFFVKPFDFSDAGELSRTIKRVMAKSAARPKFPPIPPSTLI